MNGAQIRVLTLLLLVAACSEDPPNFGIPDVEVCLMSRAGGRYCIDVYEASRRDADSMTAGVDNDSSPVSLAERLPWFDITWEGARVACESKNKRLCSREEWLDACDGVVAEAGGSKYAYGDEVDSTRCNTDGGGVEAGGSRGNCKASTGTFDQSGNLWEWSGVSTALAAARGGSFRNSQTHHCAAGDSTVKFVPTDRSEELGFRCCRDQ